MYLLIMSKHDVTPNGEHWSRLEALLVQMTAMLAQPSFSLTDFAKSYEASAHELLAAVKAHGLSSLRFEAAAKALDLRTPKSALERFVGG